MTTKDRLFKVKNWFLAKTLFQKILIVGAIAVIAWLIYTKFLAPKGAGTTYQTAQVEKGTLVSTISASGNVISSNIYSVTSQASGVIKKIYVAQGDKVVSGQKIADIELDNDGAQQAASAYASYVSAANSLKGAQNGLRSAQASLDVVYDEIKGHDTDETLVMKETRTRAEVAKDNAYNSVKSAQANLVNATNTMRNTSATITAPTSGTLTSLVIAEGVTLSASTSSSGTRTGQRVASIFKEGNPLVSVNISEIDVPNVKIDQKVTITFDSISDKTFSGKVVAIDKVGTTSSNVTNYPAIVALDTASDQIIPNMAATANIIIDIKDNVLLVPASAVQKTGNQSTVRLMTNGTPETVNVETGISSDSQIEIISGLSEGQEVVTGTTSTQSSGTNTRSVFSTGGFGGGARVIGR